jgi:hypothetical protein
MMTMMMIIITVNSMMHRNFQHILCFFEVGRLLIVFIKADHVLSCMIQFTASHSISLRSFHLRLGLSSFVFLRDSPIKAKHASPNAPVFYMCHSSHFPLLIILIKLREVPRFFIFRVFSAAYLHKTFNICKFRKIITVLANR